MPEAVTGVAGFARFSVDCGRQRCHRRPPVGRHVRWRTAGGVRYGCDANRFAAQDEVIVMMLDWNDYQRQLGATIAEIGRISPDTIRGYRGLADAGSKSGVLDGKTRELIALAVSVTRQCDGCITIHTDAAVKQGATREEIVAALSVAITVNAGASLVYSARVMDAYTAKTAETKS
jgi:AhpD family alkylhydroperoxidase